MARMVKDEEDYKPYFNIIDENRSAVIREKLKLAMKAEGLLGEFLDYRRALLPGERLFPLYD